jgi:hypothetical protein
LQRSIKTEWTKAYWTVRGFFKPNSPAFDRLKQFDETCDLPELWKTFNSIYVASANFSGFLKLYDQLHGLKYVDKNLLSEFNRLNELQRRIVQLQDDPREVTTTTPQKSTLSTPRPVNRQLDLATTITRGGSHSSSTSSSPPTSTSSTSTTPETPEGGETDEHPLEVFKRELAEKEEARRVITTLFQMRNLKEHGETIQKFITEILLRDERQRTIFSWTEARMYAELQTFLDFQPLKPAHFKALATGIKSPATPSPCGQAQCSARRQQHSAEDCWILHPEKRAEFAAKRNSTSPYISIWTKRANNFV